MLLTLVPILSHILRLQIFWPLLLQGLFIYLFKRKWTGHSNWLFYNLNFRTFYDNFTATISHRWSMYLYISIAISKFGPIRVFFSGILINIAFFTFTLPSPFAGFANFIKLVPFVHAFRKRLIYFIQCFLKRPKMRVEIVLQYSLIRLNLFE